MRKTKRWARRLFMPLLAWLLTPAAHGQSARDIGILTPFYRGTQLQGDLFGMGLMPIPGYIQGSDLAIPYRSKLGTQQQIPFVDTFTINRVMGGDSEARLQKYKRWDSKLGRSSLDYATKQGNGSIQFHPELIRDRLQPYLSAGYGPADMTLALDNVPWDLSTPNGVTAVEDPWGRSTPPGNLTEWATVVSHFASDLKAYLGPAAAKIGFETGIEFDEKRSFDGSAKDFFAYYAATERAIHGVLPGARFSPGEFTHTGECPPQTTTCVYDTRDFLEFAAHENISPSYVPRSLNTLIDAAQPWPSTTVERFSYSYSRLPPVVAEVHQFGLMFEPFGRDAGGDPGPMQANWQFQTLMRLMADGNPRKVYHWGGFQQFDQLEFLNGAGFLRLVLDRYLGRHILLLSVHDSAAHGAKSTEVMAVALIGNGPPAIILSSFSPRAAPGTRPVEVDLPSDIRANFSGAKTIRYKASDNVFMSVRRDLAAAGNLRPEFVSCALCIGAPQDMATNASNARDAITRNWPSYEAQMHAGLRWTANDAKVSAGNGAVSSELEANELLVIEPR